MKPQEKRTEHGPRYENPNPGKGCNSTHVAKSRSDWKKIANRSERRTGETTPKFRGNKRTRPSEELDDLE